MKSILFFAMFFAALFLSSTTVFAQAHLNNTSMLMYDQASAFTLTLQPASPLTANQVFTFPDLSGTVLASPTPMTDGQLLIGKSGANPVQTTLTAGTGINITNGPGTITIKSSIGFGTGGFGQSTPAAAGSNAAPAAPIMMGFAGSITITSTGRMMIIVSGDVVNSANNDGAFMQIRYGVLNPPGSPAPVHGAPVAGIAVGAVVEFHESNSNDIFPFNLNGIPIGLVAGTTYWIDLSVSTVSGNAAHIATLSDISISAIEF